MPVSFSSSYIYDFNVHTVKFIFCKEETQNGSQRDKSSIKPLKLLQFD